MGPPPPPEFFAESGRAQTENENICHSASKTVSFPTDTPDAQTLGKQVLRSGTSIAANYRAVCRARSKAEFISRMGIVVEEADETVFWLELLTETGVLSADRTRDLLVEANELVAVFGASLRTSKQSFQ
jgi:four helix bundle protein